MRSICKLGEASRRGYDLAWCFGGSETKPQPLNCSPDQPSEARRKSGVPISLHPIATGVPARRSAAPRWAGTRWKLLTAGRAALIGLLGFVASGVASAQPYPARPVTMVVPFPPGGNTDLMARALQAELGKVLGQSLIVVNKGGAAGAIGVVELIKAAPDGYTVALTPNNPLTAQPHLQKALYALDSFRYVCLTYYAPYVLIAGPQAPFKTFQEFLAFAKAKPENLVYGHPGPGSQPHLGMLTVLGAIGAQGLGVPFQGAGPMSHALLSGTVMAITETPAVAQASSLPVLAVLAPERIPSLPDVPTSYELGFPAQAFTAGGLIVHRDTPAEAVAVLEKACAEATASSNYKATVERLNATPRYLPGESFRRLFEEDSARNAEAIKQAGLEKRN